MEYHEIPRRSRSDVGTVTAAPSQPSSPLGDPQSQYLQDAQDAQDAQYRYTQWTDSPDRDTTQDIQYQDSRDQNIQVQDPQDLGTIQDDQYQGSQNQNLQEGDSQDRNTTPRLHDQGMVDHAPQDREVVDHQGEGDREKGVETHPPVHWWPFWLHKSALGAFCGLFLCFAITLIILLVYSQRNDGLAGAQQGLSYAWRFGPTAVITIISIFWSRVELQALRYMPWFSMKNGHAPDPDIQALDYTQIILPAVLVQSLKRKHFLVFFTTLTSVILKIQIVLAPSIFNSMRVPRRDAALVEVADMFHLDGNIQNETFLAYYNARAVDDFDINRPFGLAPEVAYQTFSAVEKQGLSGRPKTDEPLVAVVDALSMDVECLTLESWDATKEKLEKYPIYNFTIDLHFESCDETITVKNPGVAPSDGFRMIPRNGTMGIWMLVQDELDNKRPCSSLPQEHPQFLYHVAYYGLAENDINVPEIRSSSAVLCSPRAWISKVEVTDDGIRPNVTSLPDRGTTPVSLDQNPWNLITEAIPLGQGSWLGQQTVYDTLITEIKLSAWGPTLADARFRDDELPTRFNEYDSEALYNAIKNLTQTLGPQIAHYRLRHDGQDQVEGSIVANLERLFINEGIAVATIVLFFISAAVALWALQQSRRLSTAWARDPATILGSMTHLSAHSLLENASNEEAAYGGKRVKSEWSEATFTPLVLKVWFRSLCIIYALSLMISLAITLKISQTFDGLTAVSQSNISSLLSTSIPALAMLLVTLFCTSLDGAVRGLATHYNLFIRPCTTSELDISFLDMLGLRAMWSAVRLKVPAIVLTQMLVIICTFLTSISSILFIPEPIPDLESVRLPRRDSFGTADDISNRAPIRGLFMARNAPNLTYPDNTHDDLVFPIVTMEDNSSVEDGDLMVARIPSARIGHSCNKLTKDTDFNTTIEIRPAGDTTITLNQTFTHPNGTLEVLSTSLPIMGADVGRGAWYTVSLLPVPIPSVFETDNLRNLSFIHDFAWGEVSRKSEDFDQFSIWRCNYSWTEVETDIRLLKSGGKFQIDPNKPPVPDESTVKPWEPPFGVPYLFDPNVWGKKDTSAFPNIKGFNSTMEGVRPFPALLEPFGSIKLEDLGDPGREDFVLEEINHGLRFAWAQIANVENRLGLDQPSSTRPSRPQALPLVNATITRKQRYRLIQEEIPTAIILAILSLVVIVNAWVLASQYRKRADITHKHQRWLLNLDLRSFAPSNFNSFAMMRSLLHGSNYAKYIPAGAIHTSADQLYRVVEKRFRMGWFLNTGTREAVYTIGALDDVDFEFIGTMLGSAHSSSDSVSGVEE